MAEISWYFETEYLKPLLLINDPYRYVILDLCRQFGSCLFKIGDGDFSIFWDRIFEDFFGNEDHANLKKKKIILQITLCKNFVPIYIKKIL